MSIINLIDQYPTKVCDNNLRYFETTGTYCQKSMSVSKFNNCVTSIYYLWSKDFLEAGKKRLNGDTEREANTLEVQELRKESEGLKLLVAEQALELRVIKKSLRGLE